MPRMTSPYSPFSAQSFQPQGPPPRRGLKPWQIALLAVFGGGLVMLVVCGGLFYVGMTGISNREPTEAERAVVLTATDFAPHYGSQPQRLAEREVWNTKRNFDGTLEIEYEYDQDLAPGGDDVLAVLSSVELHPSESSARESFNMLIGAYKIGFGISGVQAREQSGSMPGMDQTHYSLILNQNQFPVGNMVVVRAGQRVHGLVVIGVYFDDPAALGELLRPTVDRSATLSSR